jgi:hypothetical protein
MIKYFFNTQYTMDYIIDKIKCSLLRTSNLCPEQTLLLGLDGRLVDDLHGCVLACFLVHALAHNGESTSAQLFTNNIVILKSKKAVATMSAV